MRPSNRIEARRVIEALAAAVESLLKGRDLHGVWLSDPVLVDNVKAALKKLRGKK